MESSNPSEALPLEVLYRVSLQVSAELEIERLLHLIAEQATAAAERVCRRVPPLRPSA